MKLYVVLTSFVFSAASLFAQAPQAATSPVPAQPAPDAATSAVLPDLDKLQSAASETTLTIGRMRIEKWKTDANSKQQAQSNADSIQRNVTAALPGMIAAVRSAPQDISAEFRLYRNVNALYDVMSSLTESAGAFGPKGEYETLAQQLEAIDSVRHDLADTVDRLTSSTQAELNNLRQQVRIAQQAAAAAALPPKTTIVDDNAPTQKSATAHKKKTTKKPAASASPDSTTSSGEAKQ